jgi:hypothetical protein
MVKNKTVTIALLTMMLFAVLGTINVSHAGETQAVKPTAIFDYGTQTQRAYIPTTVLYDPYGGKSYQKVTTSNTVTLTIQYSNTGAGAQLSGSTSASVIYSTSFSSSTSTNPSDMGPGKGDRIIGDIYLLTWHLREYVTPTRNYCTLTLDSSTYDGQFVLSRSDLSSSSTATVEDKTGQAGAFRHYWDISANTPVSHSTTYSWSGTQSVGFTFSISVFGFINFGVSYTQSYSGTQNVGINAHFEDSTNRLRFYENAASATPTLDTVYSYVFWYGPG